MSRTVRHWLLYAYRLHISVCLLKYPYAYRYIHIPINISICLSTWYIRKPVKIPICLSKYLYAYRLGISVCLSCSYIYMSINISVCILKYLYAYRLGISVSLSTYLYTYPYIRMPIDISVFLSTSSFVTHTKARQCGNLWTRPVTHMRHVNSSCPTPASTMAASSYVSHIWVISMSHGTQMGHMNESWHTYESWHHGNELCHTPASTMAASAGGDDGRGLWARDLSSWDVT